MELQVVLFVLAIVLVASVAQTVAGFGFSLIVMPFLVQVVDVHEAIVLATILALLNTALVTSRVWPHTPRAMTARMIAGAYAGMPLGLLAVLFAPEDGLRLAVGLVSLVMATLVAVGVAPQGGQAMSDVAVGGVSGLLNTSTGINGPPVVLYLQGHGLTPPQFRASLSAFFTASSLATFPLFAASGLVSQESLVLSATALPAVLVGNTAGHLLAQRLSPDVYRRIVLGLLFVTATVAAVLSAIRLAS